MKKKKAKRKRDIKILNTNIPNAIRHIIPKTPIRRLLGAADADATRPDLRSSKKLLYVGLEGSRRTAFSA